MTTLGRVGRPVGYICSDETKSKTSESMKGHYILPEQKEKTSDSLTNYWGNPYRSDEHRESNRKNLEAWKGRKLSEEHKRHISEAKKGKNKGRRLK